MSCFCSYVLRTEFDVDDADSQFNLFNRIGVTDSVNLCALFSMNREKKL